MSQQEAFKAPPTTWFNLVAAGAQGSPTGRLLCYDPADRSTRVVTEGLWFANGVALSADASWAAVVETVSLRVHRVWLSGPKVAPDRVRIMICVKATALLYQVRQHVLSCPKRAVHALHSSS